MSVLALDEDFHVHSAFSDDAVSTVAKNAAAARERGLRTLCVADHVRRDTAWVVPELAAAVADCQDERGPRVLAGVDHFFHGHLPELQAAVLDFVRPPAT